MVRVGVGGGGATREGVNAAEWKATPASSKLAQAQDASK